MTNEGNLPFGTISQKILKGFDDTEDNSFSIIDPLARDSNIRPTKTDSIKINFTPLKAGNILVRCVLESDIVKRKISGIKPENKNIIFYIKGRAVEPIISVASDSIALGNVIIHNDCPT